MTTKEEARAIIKSGYGKELFRAAASYVAPLFWISSEENANQPSVNNATIFFINSGNQTFGITVGHVYAGYRSRKQLDPHLACQIGDFPFDLGQRLIDADCEVDLATFRITEEEVRKLNKVVHQHPQSAWPPSPPTLGKGVFFCGFPSSGRAWSDRGSLNFETYFAALTADTVDVDQITCQFRREEWLDFQGNDYPGERIWLGGVSGSPLWTLTQSPNSVFGWRLAGIVVEFLHDFELLVARRPDCIQPDGQLIRKSGVQ